MSKIEYQIWILDDVIKEDGPIVEKRIMSTSTLAMAIWFYYNYEFEKMENTVIRIEKVEIDEDGNESCIELIEERTNY